MPARVYLVRHGKAEKSAASDAARRLTPEGRERCAALVRALARKLEVSRILTSPLERARETAEILAEATGAEVAEEPLLACGASTGQGILVLARSAGAGAGLVGHNPELAEAISLAAGREVEVKPGAIAAVDLDGAGARLAWIERP